MKQNKKPVAVVIGPGGDICTPDLAAFAERLGLLLYTLGYLVACGGKSGVMEAVCKGARSEAAPDELVTMGILPEADKKYANEWCDIILPTGIGYARNMVLVNSADVIIALGGGAGTLTELAYAWKQAKPVYCYLGAGGWSEALAGKEIDSRHPGTMTGFHTLESLRDLLTG